MYDNIITDYGFVNNIDLTFIKNHIKINNLDMNNIDTSYVDKKTVMITVTLGDFDYISEWIEYHYNIGISKFIIGYNGPSELFDNLPKYDYVEYIDFSTNNLECNNMFNYRIRFKNFVLFGEPLHELTGIKNNELSGDQNIDIPNLSLQQIYANILLKYVLNYYNDYDYLIFCDIDEFISLNIKIKNINLFLDKYFEKNLLDIKLKTDLYGDNNIIYKNNKSVLENFDYEENKIKIDNRYDDFSMYKCVVNLKHPLINESYFNTSHNIINKHKLKYDHLIYLNSFNSNLITLKHFYTKSFEEFYINRKHEKERYNSDFIYHFCYDHYGNKLNECDIIKLKIMNSIIEKNN